MPVPSRTASLTGCSSSGQGPNAGSTKTKAGLKRQDFEVDKILDKRVVDGRVEYLVRWKSTWIPTELVVPGEEEQMAHVIINGDIWHIEVTLKWRMRHGVSMCKVRWHDDTLEPSEHLANAQAAIAEFEGTASAHRPAIRRTYRGLQQRPILTIAESRFPPGSVLPQTEDEYHAAQLHVASTWPFIRPHPTLDLYPAIYRILMEVKGITSQADHGGKSFRNLMKLPQVRPLRWHRQFQYSRRLYKCVRRRRNAILLQVTGAEAHSHECTRCLGDRVVFFAECVRSGPTQELWFNGACANCGTQENVLCDHYTVGTTQQRESDNLHGAVIH